MYSAVQKTGTDQRKPAKWSLILKYYATMCLSKSGAAFLLSSCSFLHAVGCLETSATRMSHAQYGQTS